MVDFSAASPRGRAARALAALGCLALLPTTSAQAHAGAVPSFAETALVTRWSLPRVSRSVGLQAEPTLVTPIAPDDALLAQAAQPPALLPQSLAVIPPATRPAAAKLGEVAGPALAEHDLEARSFATYQRDRPYRTPTDIKSLEVTFQLLNAADPISTVACLKRNDCQENNPVYGKHPKPIVVVGAKTLVGAVHYWVMRSLLPDHPGMARAFGWFSVTVQGSVVGLNVSQLF